MRASTGGLCFSLIVGSVSAASAASDSQLWITNAGTVKLSDTWVVSEEVVTRFSDNRKGLYEFEVNSLVGYHLNDVVTVWAGYTHDPQYAAGDFTIMEQRAREQITLDNLTEIGPGKISARLRLEQRWRTNDRGTGWRIRPFVRYTIPFQKGGRTGITFTSEPFFDLTTTRFQNKAGLDRIRNLIALTAPLGKHLTGEFGYMNQHIFINRGPDESDNIAWLSANGSF